MGRSPRSGSAYQLPPRPHDSGTYHTHGNGKPLAELCPGLWNSSANSLCADARDPIEQTRRAGLRWYYSPAHRLHGSHLSRSIPAL